MTESRQYCSFAIGDYYFGVQVRDVQEVIRYQQMTPVPLAPAEVGGLINLRGRIVTAIDLRRRLELQPLEPGRRPMNVVVRTDENLVSLLVDEIGDVMTVEPEAYEKVPDTLTGVARELIEGVYKLKDRLLLILNTEKAINLSAA
jgi:purine-binding chemotaxis protein CheW